MSFGDADGTGGGVDFRVGDGNENSRDAETIGDFAAVAGKGHVRLACGVVGDFDVGPSDLTAPAGAEDFEHGLLGGEAAGNSLDGVGVLFAVGPFGGREDAGQKSVGVFAPDFLDAVAFDEVESVGDDGHEGHYS